MKREIEFIRQQLTPLFPERETEQLSNLIFCHVCHLQTYQLLTCKDKELSETERRLVRDMVSRLKKQEPIQYIIGETEFFGLPIKVTPHVLIPRPETEELVEWILADHQQQQHNLKMIDIGTGSGCIPIALAKHTTNASISGVDISAEALAVAAENAKQNQVAVHWIQADVLDSDSALNTLPQQDIVVSNPPYVTPQEKAVMDRNVLDYEPHSALFVPEQRPLIFYECIADRGLSLLKHHGLLYFEINALFGKETCEMLQQKGYRQIELKQDIAGKDRMIKAIR